MRGRKVAWLKWLTLNKYADKHIFVIWDQKQCGQVAQSVSLKKWNVPRKLLLVTCFPFNKVHKVCDKSDQLSSAPCLEAEFQ